jgi:hypothetical protein
MSALGQKQTRAVHQPMPAKGQKRTCGGYPARSTFGGNQVLSRMAFSGQQARMKSENLS